MCIGPKLTVLSPTKHDGARTSITEPAVVVDKTNVFKIINKRKHNSEDLNYDKMSPSLHEESDENDVDPEVHVTQSNRRGGISSGSLETNTDDRKTEKIPKDQRSRDSLTRVFNTNLFFSHLDSEERTEICDALQQQTAQPGDVIIR